MFNTALFAQIQFTITQAITLKKSIFLKLCLFVVSTNINGVIKFNVANAYLTAVDHENYKWPTITVQENGASNLLVLLGKWPDLTHDQQY
jgi:hypothetical protein